MARPPIVPSILTPAIEALVHELVTELAPRKITDVEISELLRCPIVKAPITCLTLIGLSFFGEYTHPDEKIQAFIRKNFEQMKGSLNTAIAQLFSATYIGHSVAEWGIVPSKKQWNLDKIQILKPGRYSFLGTKGNIDAVRYYSVKNIDIPYEQCLHVINNPHLAFDDPGGVSDLESAIAAVKAWKLMLSEMVIAGSRQATPLTAAYYDPDSPSIPLFNENGNPRLNLDGEQATQSPQAQMVEQMTNLENQTVAVTSIKNKIEAIATNADINFFTEGLRILHKLILMSFLFPETGFEVVGGGTGDSNLNKGHMALLRLNVEQLANQIKEVLLERLVRPLIEWNFGGQEEAIASWGEFPVPHQEEEQRVALFNALVSAVSQQVFSVDDLAVINKLYELAGLPQVEALSLPTVPADQSGSTTTVPTTDLQSFGIGLSSGDLEYWRQFEPNGHAHAVS
jgi:hypothetical protein